MSDLVAEFLKSSNIIQLIAIGIMFWFFYTRLDQKLTATKMELKQEIRDLGGKVEDIDRRLWRIEGSLATQGHCLFGQRETKKAE